MRKTLADLQRLLARWRVEHALVNASAASINLTRVRVGGAMVAALNVVHVVVFALQLPHSDGLIFQWQLAMVLLGLAMMTVMGGFAWRAHQLRFASQTPAGKALPSQAIGAGLLLAIGMTTLDQWVTPNITPFLLSTMVAGLIAYLRPIVATWIFAGAYAVFFVALGLTQINPEMLLSNRINGLTAVMLAWTLSLVMWRQFTTITLQQEQLEKTHAELQSKHRDLMRLTRLDGLTGLYNRHTFVELTSQELARAKRQALHTSLLLLDLDFFKHVNDTWGHPAGDAVLKNIANVANTSVRATDLVGRLGGEEFIILLPNTSLEAARKLAEKLRASIELSPTTWESQRIQTTVSIGLASTTAAQAHDFDHLYHVADKALYQAKEKGRNRVV